METQVSAPRSVRSGRVNLFNDLGATIICETMQTRKIKLTHTKHACTSIQKCVHIVVTSSSSPGRSCKAERCLRGAELRVVATTGCVFVLACLDANDCEGIAQCVVADIAHRSILIAQ